MAKRLSGEMNFRGLASWAIGIIAGVVVLTAVLPSALRPTDAYAAQTGLVYGIQLGHGVFRMQSDGSGLALIAADAAAAVVGAAPNGSSLAYGDSDHARLVVASSDGVPIEVLGLGSGLVGSVAWSPDSSTIAFTVCATVQSPCSLELANSDGTGLRTVVIAQGPSGVAAPLSWGYSGLVADLLGSIPGSQCGPCQGQPYLIGGGGVPEGPYPAPSGPVRVVVSQATGGPEVAATTGGPGLGPIQTLVYLSARAASPLASYANMGSATWSADGSQIFLSNGHQVLEAEPGTDGSPQVLASFPAYGIASLSWSPGLGTGPSCTVALSPSSVQGIAASPSGDGYWITDAYGSVSACGLTHDYGGSGAVHLNQPVVSISATPDGGGYRLGAYDGGVLDFGNALAERGPGSSGVSLSGTRLPAPIWSIATTSSGSGYWMATTDGHVYTFGDALFYGPTKSLHLVAALVSLTPTSDGKGYWLASSDGGVFTFGDARYSGSLAGKPLSAPIVAMAADPIVSGGYWLAGADGKVYAFGGAPSFGNVTRTTAIVRGIAATPNGDGYWLVDANGRVMPVGNARFEGSAVKS